MRSIEIPLTQGRFARVSVEDAERVTAHRWHARCHKHTFYAAGYVNGRSTYLHRFITGASGRLEFVDHIDHDGLNNTRENLRVCTPAENLANTRFRAKRLGRRGVTKVRNRWMARLLFQGRDVYLGSYDTEHEAGIAHDAAYFALYGIWP